MANTFSPSPATLGPTVRSVRMVHLRFAVKLCILWRNPRNMAGAVAIGTTCLRSKLQRAAATMALAWIAWILTGELAVLGSPIQWRMRSTGASGIARSLHNAPVVSAWIVVLRPDDLQVEVNGIAACRAMERLLRINTASWRRRTAPSPMLPAHWTAAMKAWDVTAVSQARILKTCVASQLPTQPAAKAVMDTCWSSGGFA